MYIQISNSNLYKLNTSILIILFSITRNHYKHYNGKAKTPNLTFYHLTTATISQCKHYSSFKYKHLPPCNPCNLHSKSYILSTFTHINPNKTVASSSNSSANFRRLNRPVGNGSYALLASGNPLFDLTYYVNLKNQQKLLASLNIVIVECKHVLWYLLH